MATTNPWLRRLRNRLACNRARLAATEAEKEALAAEIDSLGKAIALVESGLLAPAFAVGTIHSIVREAAADAEGEFDLSFIRAAFADSSPGELLRMSDSAISTSLRRLARAGDLEVVRSGSPGKAAIYRRAPRLVWESDCKKWRGVVLSSARAHWCDSFDGLPVDDCWEALCCRCFDNTPDARSEAELAAIRAAHPDLDGPVPSF